MRRPLLVASNRAPVTFVPEEDGLLRPRRGGGGLVTGLAAALQETQGLWVAAAMSDGDREQAARSPKGRIEAVTPEGEYRVRYLTLPPEVFDRYYNVISNRILWFLHHYLWDTVRSPRFGVETSAAWDDYVRVNEAFAGALAEEAVTAGTAPAYLVQDYHLALVPRLLRLRRRDALIAHFSHSPFAGPDYLRILPTRMQQDLLRGLLGADVLGFQTDTWAENFLLCCRHLRDARVNLRAGRVELDGHETQVRVYPISVDARALQDQAKTPEVRRLRREIARWRGEARMLLRVDRVELSKNILRGFLAYDAFLDRHPAWRGRVKFLALLNPSRGEVPEYAAYLNECLRATERINSERGSRDWAPVEVLVQDQQARAVAAYGLYDALLVNPIFDGMNLVAMEGPSVNRREGVLVLSRNAGAYSRLGRHALGVNPFDIEETAGALDRALAMPVEERARRARGLRRAVVSNPPARWVGRQLEDLERVAAGRSS